MGTGGKRSSPNRATTHSYRSGSVFPRNCKVMCHDSGLDHRSPSPSDRSRAEAAVNSHTAVAANGIPTNRRIRSYLRRAPASGGGLYCLDIFVRVAPRNWKLIPAVTPYG